MDRDKFEEQLSAILENKYDTEAWHKILRLVHNEPVENYRENIYEHLVAVFPTSGKFWKVYIEHEIRGRNYERVEKLFQRCLMKVLNIDLWKTYLNYVKDTKASLPTYKEKMAQAYDFALNNMGMDFSSFTLWSDYILFLKNVEAAGSYAENQKISAIRKIYHRGIVIPMLNVESLWKEYIAFENAINPMIAEKMTGEKSRDYMNARRVAKEYEAITRGLDRAFLSLPPCGSIEEIKQVEIWQKYIAWERSNPLRIEDQVALNKRIMFAFEQSLLSLGHFPNIWHAAASHLQECSRILSEKGDVDNSKSIADQIVALYEKAISNLHAKNLILYLAFADFEEQQMKTESAHEIYKKFLAQEGVDPTLCYIHYMRFCRRNEGTTSARSVFKRARDDTNASYHVYVGAALMEYFSTKDKKIASNIFELGFKRYKDRVGFVKHYLDFLIHLNDDNNTRVLFERVLSADTLPPKDAKKIWTEFMDFESTVGDLSSIKKVEKRVLATMTDSNGEANQAAQLIERYKVFDLWPCSKEELIIHGLSELAPVEKSSGGQINIEGSNGQQNSRSSTSMEKVKKALPTLAAPDIAQMTPFKPSFNWRPGQHRIPGGVFPMPPLAADLCTKLPPPDCFNGPYVILDQLLRTLQSCTLSVPTNDIKAETINANIKQEPNTNNNGKRKASRDREQFSDNEDEEEIPTNDLYRKRQQKRIK